MTMQQLHPDVQKARDAAKKAAAQVKNIPTATMGDEDYEALARRAKHHVEIARSVFVAKAPYWSDVIFGVAWMPVKGFGTFAVTERGQLIYDPGAVIPWEAAWGKDAIAGVVAHEALHLILLHMLRRGTRDPKLWNIAADLFINGMLGEAGWTLPPVGIFPRMFQDAQGQPFPNGLTADEYYDLLVQNPDVDWVGAGPAAGKCGSGAGGEPLPDEPEGGSLPEDQERSMDDLRTLAEQAARKTADAAASGVGNIPGHLKRWASETLKPSQVHWTTHLRISGSSVLARAGAGRRTYARPHRRQACLGMHPRTPILPSRTREQVVLLFAIDTSGSMGRREILAVVSEMVAIAKSRRGRVFVVACDADVQGEPVELRGAYQPTLERIITGGGGTDFRPVFEAAEAMRPRPDLVVIGTDAGGPVPPRRPDIPAIWLSTTGERPPGCAWGELIPLRA